MKFSEILLNAIGRDGLKTVANDIEVNEATLSRFQSNQGGLFLEKIDRVFEREGCMILTEHEYIQMEQEHMRDIETLRRVCELWLETMPRRR